MGDRAQEDDEQEPHRQQSREADIDEDLNLDGGAATQAPFADKIKVLGKVSVATYFGNVAQLNEEQRLFLTHVLYHIRNNRDLTRRRFYNTAVVRLSNNTTFTPLHLLVTGSASTGKSMLISALYQSLVREFDTDADRDMTTPSVLLCVFTGMAACNIGGRATMQSFSLTDLQKSCDEERIWILPWL